MKAINKFTALFLLVFAASIFAQVPAPENLTAEFRTHGPTPMHTYGFVELNWTMPSSPTPTMYFFKIFRKDPNATNFRLIMDGWRGTKFFDYNVAPEKAYEYYVKAFNSTGISPESNHATVTTPPIPDLVKFVGEPPRTGSVGVQYVYDVNAVSNNPTAVITYSLELSPDGMTINASTGLILWTPTTSGDFHVQVKAVSYKGGIAFHGFKILVYGPSGFITGTVTDDSTGNPISGVAVYFINLNAHRHDLTYTNNFGNFNKALPIGLYKIKYFKNGYIPEFYNNKTDFRSADSILLGDFAPVTASAGLSKVLPPVFYNVRGWVKNASGEPVRSAVTISIARNSPSPSMVPPHHTVVTDSLGNYNFRVIGGLEYVVFAKPFNHTYYPEFWDNKRTFLEADKILVNENKTDINFTMDLKPVYANGVSGQVKHFTSGDGVPAHVNVYRLLNTGFRPFKSTRSDSLGNYLIENLEPGKYIIHAIPRFPFFPGYYKLGGVAKTWRQADTVVVADAGIQSSLDINLLSRTDTGFAVIAGKVRTTQGDNLAGGIVLAIDVNGEIAGSAETDVNGSYTIEDIPAGSYTLSVDAVGYLQGTTPSHTVDYANNSSEGADLIVSPTFTTSVVDKPVGTIPTGYELMQNYPNPFNPSTLIKFGIPEKSNVNIAVYNLIGEKVVDLVSEEMNAGYHEIQFNANQLSSGVYLYRIEAGRFISVKKMLLLK
ncbi:MAG: carboxypeptidase regulatory-like domain-containing protein [Bacteroidetes bacterium]|nr:carboxypeptidase regulatory-like domain-containing protein [Bacteroidota bacterium]MBU2586364.1 carboxypeptidase regulatory-like domain-containing protein [Bacteroidota bacterium]